MKHWENCFDYGLRVEVKNPDAKILLEIENRIGKLRKKRKHKRKLLNNSAPDGMNHFKFFLIFCSSCIAGNS